MPVTTRENLVDKIKALKSQQEQVIAQANGVSGAIQVLEQLLSEFDAPAKTEEEPK